MSSYVRVIFKVVKWSMYLALGWLIGILILGIAVIRFFRLWLRARRALAPTITCPWCHSETSQYFEYRCSHCHMRRRGFAWRCSCGAIAGHLDCEFCGLSIPNPLLEK